MSERNSTRKSFWQRLASVFWDSGQPRTVVHRVFAAAQVSRLTDDWFAQILSGSQEIQGDIRRLRGSSRAYGRDNPYGARFVKMCRENIVGHMGIQLQLRTPDKERNKRVESAFKAWADEPLYASADGKLSWCELQQAIAMAMPTDGFALLRHIPGADNPFGYSVQLLDADLLDHEYGQSSALSLPNGNQIRLGIETAPPYGRVVAYYMWTQHPSESGGKRARVRIPAEEIELIHDPIRVGQPLGVPWFAPVLFVAQMAGGMEEAAITAGRIGASSGAAITTDPEKMVSIPKVAPGQTTTPQDFEPGRFWRLAPGESLVKMDMQYPSESYGPFMKNMRMSESVGLNVAYSSLTGDLESVNFSSIRAGLVVERDGWRNLQYRVITHGNRPVFRNWARQAALGGMISAEDARDAMLFQTWKPRGWKWVDPQAEVQANMMAVDQLFTTRSEICAEQGLDFEDVLARAAEEEAMIRAAGLTVPGVSLNPIIQTTNQPSDGQTQTGKGRTLALARAHV